MDYIEHEHLCVFCGEVMEEDSGACSKECSDKQMGLEIMRDTQLAGAFDLYQNDKVAFKDIHGTDDLNEAISAIAVEIENKYGYGGAAYLTILATQESTDSKLAFTGPSGSGKTTHIQIPIEK